MPGMGEHIHKPVQTAMLSATCNPPAIPRPRYPAWMGGGSYVLSPPPDSPPPAPCTHPHPHTHTHTPGPT
jgi:hypothetical protein